VAWDSIADNYDRTRGGEPRGDAYAAELDKYLDRRSPVLDIGTGTGVVAKGLRRRGYHVVGVDRSEAMLGLAKHRIGTRVVLGDACDLPFADRAARQAIAVWVLHSVAEPTRALAEVFRVIAPGGRLLVCPVNRATDDDAVGKAFEDLGRRVDRIVGLDQREVTAGVIEAWGAAAGFRSTIEALPEQSWTSTIEREVEAIESRMWSPLAGLTNEQYHAATEATLSLLRGMGTAEIRRRAHAELVVLARPER
jgi:ubiquinone/menaquinone biosynthesis C-methylase UbiE